MKKYEAYKDSGVEWIGGIPEHWLVKRLKYIKSDAKNSFVDGPFGSNLKTDHFIDNGDVYVIDSGFITSGTFEFKREFKTISREHFETVKRSECNTDDIIISKIGANFGMSGILPELDKPSLVSGNTLKLTVNTNKYNLRLIHLQLLNLKQYGEIDLLVKGSAQPALSMGAMSNLPFVISEDLEEQKKIFSYLYRRTSQLDTLITKKENLIELLQEERTAIINHAVTKGLDPNVPMKDSGIEWLGEIPEHWEVKKLKYLLKHIKGGGTPSTDNPLYWNGSIPWVSPKDMKVPFIDTTEDYVTEIAIKESNTMLIEEGHVLLVVRSGILKHTLPLAINNVKVTLNQDMKALLGNKLINTLYLFSLLSGFSDNILTLCKKIGATVDSLDMEVFLNFNFPVPPTTEQNSIINFIESTKEDIDLIVSKTQQEIELLSEYKTALISEVVTGKVDVRNEVIN